MSWIDGRLNIPLELGDGDKRGYRKRLATFENILSHQLTFERLAEDAENRYDIKGLPKTISKRVVLQSLLWHACVVFFEKDGNLFALPGAPTGDFNIYGEPAGAQVFSMNGRFNEPVSLYIPGSEEATFLELTDFMKIPGKARGVIVWENKERYPFINAVFYFAKRISDTLRTLDVVRKNIKSPLIFFAEEGVVESVRKFLEDRDANLDAIALDKNAVSTGVFDGNKVKAMPIDAHGTALNDITALVEWYESKYRELCGVENNAQMDKKGENLISDEVSVNDEYTNLGVDKCIETMTEYFDYVNKIFGTSITVEKKEKEEKEDEKNLRSDGSSRGSDVSGDSE